MLVVMYRVCVALVLLAGCGRLGFAPPEDGTDSSTGDEGGPADDARAGDGSSALACQQNPYTYLGVGTLFLVAGQSASTVYIDDVAAGTQPLGCS